MEVTAQVDTPQPLIELTRSVQQHDGFQEAITALAQGDQAAFDGAVGGGCALALAAVASRADRVVVVVCQSEDAADTLVEEFRCSPPAIRFVFPLGNRRRRNTRLTTRSTANGCER